MQIIQACGPFTAGNQILFNIPEGVGYQTRYIKLGVQAPQVPPLSESLDFPTDLVQFDLKIENNHFIINANDILEFEDFNEANIFYVTPLQNMDAYTIIDIAFMDEESA